MEFMGYFHRELIGDIHRGFIGDFSSLQVLSMNSEFIFVTSVTSSACVKLLSLG
jgi:hypothetical protein